MFSNNMTDLVNKIERRLGMRPLNLPKELAKDKWANVIIEDSITTFSRYFPHKFRYEVVTQRDRGKDGYYLIDENYISGDVEIIGVRDIAWDDFTGSSATMNQTSMAINDFYGSYSMDDMMGAQTMSNQVSLFNNGIYVDFVSPNKIKLSSVTNANIARSLPSFKVDLLIKHSPNLNTIAPTKMETFEKLAQADIAVFLYNELKYFDNLETIFAGNIDLKLSDLQTEASKREEIEQQLKDGYISAANENQPVMYTV